MSGRLVTVVVPVYNGAEFLAETLDALLAQDYEPIEILVVDDGSSDGSAEIASSRVGVEVIRQPNAGPSAARNTGIQRARGEFITFCDADDCFRPDKVSSQVEFLESRPDVGCVLTGHRTFYANGVGRPDWLTDEDGVQPQSAMVRRSVVDAVGGFNPDYQLTEGLEWLSRMRDAGVQIDVVAGVHVDRRIHGTNLSYQRSGLQHHMLRSLRERIERRREVNADDN